MQTSLFGDPPAVERRCGTCVTRNAQNEAQARGNCTIAGEDRAHDAPACDRWFGLAQLRASLYGKG